MWHGQRGRLHNVRFRVSHSKSTAVSSTPSQSHRNHTGHLRSSPSNKRRHNPYVSQMTFLCQSPYHAAHLRLSTFSRWCSSRARVTVRFPCRDPSRYHHLLELQGRRGG